MGMPMKSEPSGLAALIEKLWTTAGSALSNSMVMGTPAAAVRVEGSKPAVALMALTAMVFEPAGGPPLGGGGGVSRALACSLATQASKSAGETARTVKYIWACDRPQNSAHWPPKVPGSSIFTGNWLVRPGMASIL